MQNTVFGLIMPAVVSAPPVWLQVKHEQPVVVAVGIDTLDTVDLEPGLRTALRVELHELDSLVGDSSQERDVVGLGHGMVHCDIVLVLYNLQVYRMLLIRSLGLKGRKRYAAACHDSLSCGLDDIAADRTDIKPGLLHVRGPVLVPDVHAGEKLNHRDI